MGRPTKARQAEIAARRTQAVKMRTEGKSWQVISDTCGYGSAGDACKDVTRALEANLKDLTQSIDVLREQELARLDMLYAAAVEVLRRHHVLVSGGKIVREDPAGEPLRDSGPVLAAIETLRKLDESRRKLLGLDSAIKVETTGTVRVEVAGVDMETLR